ncbi:MAG: hypothetical protein HYS26_01525 [Candidatus Kaiserbacteria bacterium]|nr:MAG: hypothetical protein HYS26_01525 [Candidatus Kaiserbacteria bacterium]
MPTSGPQPSFIPREAPTVGQVHRAQGNALSDLTALVSLVLFVASLALAGGVFLYDQYLQSSSASKIDQLERAKAAFEPTLIEELTRLDDRMRAAGEVLQQHISPSAFFQMLEASTISTVAFTSLDFQVVDNGRMTVDMDGVAASVNSIALQADVFSKGGMVTNPIFSNIDRESDGVHFDLSAFLNPVAINYAQLVSGAAAAFGAQPAQTIETAPAETQDAGAIDPFQPGATQ